MRLYYSRAATIRGAATIRVNTVSIYVYAYVQCHVHGITYMCIAH